MRVLVLLISFLLALSFSLLQDTAPRVLPPPAYPKHTPIPTYRNLNLMSFIIETGTLTKNYDTREGRYAMKSVNIQACTSTVHRISTQVFETFEPVIFAACLSFDIVELVELFLPLPAIFSRPFRVAKRTMFFMRGAYSNLLIATYVYNPFTNRKCVSGVKKPSAKGKQRNFPGIPKRGVRQAQSSVDDFNMKAIQRKRLTPGLLAYFHSMPPNELAKLIIREIIIGWGFPDPKIPLKEIKRLTPKTKFQFTTLGLFWTIMLSWGHYVLQVRDPQNPGFP